MKIALVCPYALTYFGGVQKHVRALQKEIRKMGHQAKILAPRARAREDYGPDVLLLGSCFTIPANASRAEISLSNPFQTERVLKAGAFDLYHFHSLGPFLGNQILEAATKLGATKILTAHAHVDKSFVAQNFPLFIEMFYQSALEKMDGVIAVSQTAAKLLKSFSGTRQIIPNGVDLEVYRPRGLKVSKFNDGKINVLFVGRLDERKGILLLLKAWRILVRATKKARLLVIGEGHDAAQAKSFIRQKKLTDVRFLGPVSEAELPSYYCAAQIFCAPSLGSESFGMVLLEAMASGLPVVASRIEGYKEVLTGQGAELLFKTNDVGELVRILSNLIESERLREKYSRWGLKEVQKYAWPKVARKILDFYEQVKNRRARR